MNGKEVNEKFNAEIFELQKKINQEEYCLITLFINIYLNKYLIETNYC